MASLYANENFRYQVVRKLRQLGHDVLTAREAGRAGRKVPDADVLAYGIALRRAILTFNRRDFIKLHKQTPRHSGIIVCTFDKDSGALAQRIHQSVQAASTLDGKLLRINRPHVP
jgi:hypothetical protein